jgi:uncharacterized protein YjbI with pentapeptide repeats
MAGDLPEKVLQCVDESRRSFLSKLILGSAFGVPNIASFSMSGLAVGETFAHCTNLTILCSNQAKSTDCSLIHDGATNRNFAGCNYAGRNFQGFRLFNNCFQGANFAGANLSRSILTQDNFVDANLAGANLYGARLVEAILICAHLPGAKLNNANLMNALLRGADLNGANLYGATLIGADLRDANLNGANLNGVIWGNTTCPDGTNSDDHGGTCVFNL